MKPLLHRLPLTRFCALLLPGLLGLATLGYAAPVLLYSTQFEAAEGFVSGENLYGQNGWTNSGSGGNGLTDWNAIYGYEQSGFIGFSPPTSNGLYLWRPINHTPSNLPLVTVEFDMSLTDSTTTNRDEFRWSVYNMDSDRLFSLVFDVRDLDIYAGVGIYQLLDNEAFKYTGWEIFTNDVYSVKMQMNFAANQWSAWVGGVQVVTNELITTLNAPRTFGDVDAVWLPGYASGPGDNFMVFDDLTITADVAQPPIATLEPPLPIGGGQYLIRVHGDEGMKVAVEASTNLTNWLSLKTNVVTGGYFDFLDTTSVGLPRRFYRARFVP